MENLEKQNNKIKVDKNLIDIFYTATMRDSNGVQFKNLYNNSLYKDNPIPTFVYLINHYQQGGIWKIFHSQLSAALKTFNTTESNITGEIKDLIEESIKNGKNVGLLNVLNYAFNNPEKLSEIKLALGNDSKFLDDEISIDDVNENLKDISSIEINKYIPFLNVLNKMESKDGVFAGFKFFERDKGNTLGLSEVHAESKDINLNENISDEDLIKFAKNLKNDLTGYTLINHEGKAEPDFTKVKSSLENIKNNINLLIEKSEANVNEELTDSDKSYIALSILADMIEIDDNENLLTPNIQLNLNSVNTSIFENECNSKISEFNNKNASLEEIANKILNFLEKEAEKEISVPVVESLEPGLRQKVDIKEKNIITVLGVFLNAMHSHLFDDKNKFEKAYENYLNDSNYKFTNAELNLLNYINREYLNNRFTGKLFNENGKFIKNENTLDELDNMSDKFANYVSDFGHASKYVLDKSSDIAKIKDTNELINHLNKVFAKLKDYNISQKNESIKKFVTENLKEFLILTPIIKKNTEDAIQNGTAIVKKYETLNYAYNQRKILKNEFYQMVSQNTVIMKNGENVKLSALSPTFYNLIISSLGYSRIYAQQKEYLPKIILDSLETIKNNISSVEEKTKNEKDGLLDVKDTHDYDGLKEEVENFKTKLNNCVSKEDNYVKTTDKKDLIKDFNDLRNKIKEYKEVVAETKNSIDNISKYVEKLLTEQDIAKLKLNKLFKDNYKEIVNGDDLNREIVEIAKLNNIFTKDKEKEDGETLYKKVKTILPEDKKSEFEEIYKDLKKVKKETSDRNLAQYYIEKIAFVLNKDEKLYSSLKENKNILMPAQKGFGEVVIDNQIQLQAKEILLKTLDSLPKTHKDVNHYVEELKSLIENYPLHYPFNEKDDNNQKQNTLFDELENL